MAIALNPTYPIPNRSGQPVNRTKDADGVIDIGWCEGAMTDGRAFRAELWAQDGVTMLTVFFATASLESLTDGASQRLLEHEGIVAFDPVLEASVHATTWIDSAGAELWSVGVVVGDDDHTFVIRTVPIFPYRPGGAPHSLFSGSRPTT